MNNGDQRRTYDEPGNRGYFRIDGGVRSGSWLPEWARTTGLDTAPPTPPAPMGRIASSTNTKTDAN